ncbi:hypothetical protein [Gilliamella apicola]|uniref:spermine/spermidine synthase domain-containing protein n=1 Tax=Gilliamella apicola TaxID=1196095 RepID=UPI002FEE570B|nr:hypothetical protein [Gilliamella apicola]
MMKYFAWSISLLVGLMSLGQEMLWFRIISFMLGGAPFAFALVLFFFLLGIAFGASKGKTICTRYSNLFFAGGMVLICAGFIDIAIPFIILQISQDHVMVLPLCVCIILIFFVAALKAILFPIVHHLGTNIANGKVGASVSKVYFFNIIGSTLGSLLIGGILLDYVSISSMFILIGIVCILIGSLMAVKKSVSSVITVIMLGSSCFYLVDKHTDYIFRTLYGKEEISVNTYVENRYGIIHIVNNDKEGIKNIVLGNNMYDGMINIDPDNDINDLNRLYLLAAVHPNPKKVLVIGVSAGAWTRALSSFPTLETIDAIEINKGYIDIIKQYPVVSPILNNPKINIHIDDGRRWLKRNSSKKYDLIIMNTTYHWRSGTTNLLSQEMMKIAENSLNPDGILAFNSTRSPDTLKTAQSVFKYAYWGKLGFIYASDSMIKIDEVVAKDRLDKLILDGKPLFNEESKQRENGAYKKTLSTQLLTLDEFEKLQNLGRDLEIITDSNMITEYKYGLLGKK